MAGWATKIEGQTIPISVPYAAGALFTHPRCANPSAWSARLSLEFPFAHGRLKLGPALTTGNCVVLKPAEQTPFPRCGSASFLRLAFPKASNIVTGLVKPPDCLAAHDDVDKVAFTGSTRGENYCRAKNWKKVSRTGRQISQHHLQGRGRPRGCDSCAANAIFFNTGKRWFPAHGRA
jgi:phenylacetaldehyde dehydrogenase